jgi:hypothetical protein
VVFGLILGLVVGAARSGVFPESAVSCPILLNDWDRQPIKAAVDGDHLADQPRRRARAIDLIPKLLLSIRELTRSRE